MILNPDSTKRGSFIALYGANNLGKSTQLAKLVSKLTENGHQSFLVIKYPIYRLHPTGPVINELLRGKGVNKIEPRSFEMQKLYAQNREQYRLLAERYGWTVLNANLEAEVLHGLIWDFVSPAFRFMR